ncbi:MAG: NADH:flavin oxidoreductase/NADH oxidase family protein [Alphaproteobacteria bacterium]|nr:NADH:flavin oxidoreductase/NADH oxidase family protein [Alphaproteobacteria bacterium]
MTSPLAQPLTLPCGVVLANRIAKAAMSEGMADAANHATPRLTELYRRWAGSGAGLLLSGNIQVDPWHLERPGNVVLEDESGLAALETLTAAARSGGAEIWAQLGHTGRQVSAAINPEPLSPSDVQLEVLRGAGLSFARPRAMTEAEIEDAVNRFAVSARLAIKAGFTGIALHGAHGYLISQFLSPLTNRRSDRWGGTLEKRARFPLAAIAAVRAVVGPAVPIGLKLNASDFLRGGFTHAECLRVVGWLNDSTLDLLELSGGSMEQPKVVGVAVKDQGVDGARESTAKREAYFIAFAGDVRRVARMPVMVTGGFRTRATMEAALAAGELDVVGLGRPLIADPLTPAKLLAGTIDRAQAPEVALDLFDLLPWFNMQMERMGDGLDPDLTMTGAAAAAGFPALEQGVTDALLRHRANRRAG